MPHADRRDHARGPRVSSGRQSRACRPARRAKLCSVKLALAISAACASAGALAPQSASAQIATGWKGTAGTLWSDAGNWDNTGPASGARDLYFGNAWIAAGSAGSIVASNDIAGPNLHKIVFESSVSTPAFTITGNGFRLFDFGGASPVFPQIVNQSNANQTFNLSSGSIQLNDTSGSTKAEILANGGGNLSFSISTPIDLGNTTQLQFNSVAGRTITFNAAISSSGNGGNNSVAINGVNNIIFAAANTYAGDTFINGGTLQLAAGGSIASSFLRLGDTAANSPAATLSLINPTGGQTMSRPINVRLSGSGSTGTRTIKSTNVTGTNTVSGNMLLDADLTVTSVNAGATLALTGATLDLKTRTMIVTGSGNTTISGALQNSSAGGKFVKSGFGTLTLTASNSYTGASTFSGGNTVLSGANGALTGGILTVNSGSLVLDNTGANNNNRLANGAIMTINGGTLSVIGNATTSLNEAVGQLMVGSAAGAGGLTTVVVQNGGAGTSAVLDLGAGAGLNHADSRPTLNFVGLNGVLGSAGNNPRIIFSAAPPSLSNGVISDSAGGAVRGWATVNGSDFAGYDNTNGVKAATPVDFSTASTTDNAILTASATYGGSGKTVNTLKINASTPGQSLTVTGSGNVNANAILLTGANDFTISASGTGKLVSGATLYTYVNTDRTLTITSFFNSQPVVKSGPGAVRYDFSTPGALPGLLELCAGVE